MKNCLSIKASKNKALPVDTPFQLPSPLPSWPSGGGFGTGIINLGGLEVTQVTTFTKIWSATNDTTGATFFKPSPLPAGFHAFGHYAQPNGHPLSGWLLVGKPSFLSGTMAPPADYTLIWASQNQDNEYGYFWLPVAPKGYRALGIVVTTSPDKPSPDEVRCVRGDHTEEVESEGLLWSSGEFAVGAVTPIKRGVNECGVRVGTFTASSSTATAFLACLKNNEHSRHSSMPNLAQIQTLMQVYSPRIYFHPDEEYLPSSVSWFFENGAVLHDNAGKTSSNIGPDGSNLPQNGSNDGAYWIDLPLDPNQREVLKRGDLKTSKVYVHVKPMLGGTFSDVVVWLWYPFNGPAKAKVKCFNIKLGQIGEHVGDWEHVALRVSNLNGQLWRVYFGHHSSGEWRDAWELEYEGGNKAVAYSSLHGHAMYPHPGTVLQGNTKLNVGIRNDCSKGSSIDTGDRYEVMCAEYLGAVAEPAWLNYMREWGPKIEYDVAEVLRKFIRIVPGKLRSELERIVRGLPAEVLGEEGPTGPKVKGSWTDDEK